MIDIADVIAARDATFLALLAVQPGRQRLDADTVRAATADIPIPVFNGVWPLGPNARLADVRDAVDFVTRTTPMCSVQLRPGYDAAIDSFLADREFAPEPGDPLMASDVTPSDVEPISGFVMRRAKAADLPTFISTSAAAFGMPAELQGQLISPEVAALPEVTLWVGEVEGEMVSTAMTCRAGGASGMFAVTTSADHRQRGYGAALIAAAAKAELEAGARFVWLQTSAEAFEVYRTLGFATLETWATWST